MFANLKFFWNGKTYQGGQEIPKDEFDPEDLASLQGAGLVSSELCLIPDDLAKEIVEAIKNDAVPAQPKPPAKRGGKKDKPK